MSRRETLSKWLSTSDAAFSWGERIARFFGLGIGGSVLVSILGIVGGFVVGNPLYGLVIGVVIGLLVLGGFGVKALSLVSAGTPAVSQTRLSPEELYGENQELKERVRELEEENGRLTGGLDSDFRRKCEDAAAQLRILLEHRENGSPLARGEIAPLTIGSPTYAEDSLVQGEYDSETIRLYKEQFEGTLLSISRQAIERGLLNEDERKNLRVSDFSLTSGPDQIRRIISYLESFT